MWTSRLISSRILSVSIIAIMAFRRFKGRLLNPLKRSFLFTTYHHTFQDKTKRRRGVLINLAYSSCREFLLRKKHQVRYQKQHVLFGND